MISVKQLLLNHGRTASVLAQQTVNGFHTSSALERARKGTRERKRKIAIANKKKKEERLRKNPPPLPYKVQLMLASKGLLGPPKPIREKDSHLSFPVDNVYFMKDYAYKRYSFEDAISNLRHLYHPTTYNCPNGMVFAKIELDMRGSKKDRYLDEFSKTVPIMKSYERNIPDRNVCAFVSGEAAKIEALQSGAKMAGGQELITEISKGRIEVADIDNFIGHTELLKAMKPLVGLLRDKMPSVINGTIGDDVPLLIKKFGKGMEVEIKKVKPALGTADEPDYGYCVASIGLLEMEVADMEENLTALLETINEHKPKRKEKDGTEFITRVMLFLDPPDFPEIPNSKFSIIHDIIDDNRVEEQEKTLREGREQIAKTVAELKLSNSSE